MVILNFDIFVCLVPSAPEDIKAAAVNSDSVLVSWLPPAWPNGEILTYTLYRQTDRVSTHSPKLTTGRLHSPILSTGRLTG
jgi:Fibronectin type III domain